jgi:transposase
LGHEVVIQVTSHTRILVAVEPVDFRNGIDGLARICKEVLKADPFAGWLFVFRGRRGTSIKVLAYDSQGFWLCQKRMSHGKFRYWPGRPPDISKFLEAHELQVLLAGGDPAAARGAPAWRRVNPVV